jgi:hypothetical protein
MKLEGTLEMLSTNRGRFTRITLDDGYQLTFVGPCSKREAVRQARQHQAKGTPSESTKEEARS